MQYIIHGVHRKRRINVWFIHKTTRI